MAQAEAYTVPAKNLFGHIAHPEGIGWWTFETPDARPETWTERSDYGAAYGQDLALPTYTLEVAENDGVMIEIRLTRAHFESAKAELFKPSALDGFCATTAFVPDWSEAPYGWTKPAGGDGTHKRPELVSAAFAYREAFGPEEAPVSFRRLPYQKRA